MGRLLLVANPSASGFTGALHRDVMRTLSKGHETTTVWPGSAEEARYEATQAAAAGFDVVAAMGGDGVAHHVANGLIGTRTALGLIPAGTTNVLARVLGIPVKPRRSADVLATASGVRVVPTARLVVDGVEGRSQVHALFAAGVGLDADIVAEAERRPHGKLRFGGLYYARTALRVALGRYRKMPPSLRVEAEGGRRADAVAVMVQIHEHYTYFGRKPLALDRSSTEGLTVLSLPGVGFVGAGTIIGRLATNRSLHGAGSGQVWPGLAKLVVEADPPALLQADGELIGQVRSLEIAPSPTPLFVAV